MSNSPGNKVVFWIAIVSVVLSLGYYMFFAKDQNIEGLLHEAVPEANTFEQINKDPLAFKALRDSKLVAYCIIDEASGYQSNIVMLVAVDSNGTLLNALVVEQQETPSFFKKLIDDDFFSQFAGQKINDGFELGTNIDAITGSTVSSKAVTKAVNKAVKYVGAKHLNIEVRDPYAKVEFGAKEIVLITIMALALYATYRRKTKVRTAVLVFSVVVLGFWYNAFITYGILASLIGGSIPSPQNLGWYILVGGTLIIVFATGKNIFCYWMCPFGAMQEIIYKFGIKGFKVSPKIEKWARKLPGLLAWLSLVLAFLMGNPNIASYEPFGTLFSQTGTGIQWALLPLVLFMNLIISRFWCKYFCPVGFVMNLVAKLKRNGVTLWRKVTPGKIMSS